MSDLLALLGWPDWWAGSYPVLCMHCELPTGSLSSVEGSTGLCSDCLERRHPEPADA